MWLERVDFRVLQPDKEPNRQSRRELGTAVVLCDLVAKSGGSDRWQAIDDLIRLFVGRQDSMNLAQLQDLLTAAGIRSLEDITSAVQLDDLQQRVREGRLGKQLYSGDLYFSPFGPEPVQLPQALRVSRRIH